MAGLQHARIGASLEVASASLAGHRFEKHSHDEFVISANLCGLEDVWLDGRTFQADSGDLTLYNPGQIQGGGVRDGQPWRFASLYLPAAELASSLDLSSVEFDRPPLLAERLAEPPDLDGMAEQVGLSKYHLLRAFKKATGLSPRQWSMQLRTRRALGLLRRGLAVGEVAHALGFADQSHLTRYFTSAYGISPGRYQRAVRG